MAARKPPDEIQHERIYLHLQTTQEQVVPAVLLPQRQIKMTFSSPEEHIVPSIVASSGNGSEAQIVGSQVFFGGQNQGELTEGISGEPSTSLVPISQTQLQKQQTIVTSVQTSFASTPQVSQTKTATGSQSASKLTWSQKAQQKAQARAFVEKSLSQVMQQGSQTQQTVVFSETSPQAADLEEFAEEHLQQLTEQTVNRSSASRLSVEYKSHMAMTESMSNVLEFFEEQDKTLKEHGGSFHRHYTQRSPSPSPVRQSVGLDHLDNLVKLMEQLSTLKDENVKLKKKCAYLESTKSLLEVKNALEQEILDAQAAKSSPSSPKPKRGSQKSRGRLSSAEESKELEIMDDSQSETSLNRELGAGVHKRCHSTGSIDIPSEIAETVAVESIIDKVHSKSYEKASKSLHLKSSKSPALKRKSKISNWAKFKKVITRPKLPEEISFSLRYIKDFGRGSVSSPKELTVPTSNLENRSVDSGMGSGLEADGQENIRKSTSSGEPSSPTFVTEPVSEVKDEGGDEDLGTEIWMGDPDWLEKHEDELLIDSINREVIVLNSTQKSDSEHFLTVPMPRRKSSPSLLENENNHDDQDLSKEYLNLRRSSSYKGRSSHGDIGEITLPTSPKLEKKEMKPTWGKRVKHIVHNRKDSIKKIMKRGGKMDFDSGEVDIEEEDIKKSHQYGTEHEGPLGRSTPKTSPIVLPRHKGSESPPGSNNRGIFIPKQGSLVDVEAILGSMSNEFSKKMEEWETKRSKSIHHHSSPKDVSESSDLVIPESLGTVSPEFQKKMEDWERTKSLKAASSAHKPPEDRDLHDSKESSPVPGTGDLHQSVPPVEELQRKLTDSFNRKLEEWERIKYRKESTSPTFDRPERTSKSLYAKTDKSRKGNRDKGKSERRRERDLQRVEREQHKLDKERIRIEKERLKALEREVRIEKMKGRLSQSEVDGKQRSPVLSPLENYKVTTDFAKKLYEWESKKGISALSMATYLETQQKQMDQLHLLDKNRGEDEKAKLDKGQRPPPLTLQPCQDSPEEVSPAGDRSSDVSFEDTSVNTEADNSSNLVSLEKANTELMLRRHEKVMEYENLLSEVADLSSKLERVKEQHSKEAGFHGEQSPPPPQTEAIIEEFADLEDKIGELEDFGQHLAISMESAAVCKWQNMEGQESINARLVDLLEQMKGMLMQAAKSDEASKTSSALKSFEKLYRQAMQLQVQLSNFHLSQIERDKEIMTMKRQLLLQEANNLILQTNITRREAELQRYRNSGSRKGSGIKRWNTYSGMEGRALESEEVEPIPPIKRFSKGRSKDARTAVAPPAVVMEMPEQKLETSTEDTFMRADQTTGTIVAVKQEQKKRSKEAATFHNHLVDSLEYIDENVTEIDHMEQQVERLETEDSIKLSQEEQVIKVCAEKSMEISTIQLPTANISMPKDISKHELSVPRSRLSQENIQETEILSAKKESKFPELLIPEWKKSSEKVRSMLPSLDSDSEPRPADMIEHLRIDSTDSEKHRSEGHSDHSVSKSVEDTEGSSLEQDVFYDQSFDNQKAVHSAPASQSGTMETRDQKEIIKAIVEAPTSLSHLLDKRSTHPPAHWPTVRPVSSAHRIKPANELLEESRRFRQGQSSYTARIKRKYALSDDASKYVSSQLSDKENIKEGYVKAIVRRLSRESTPEYNQRISEISSTTLGSLTVHQNDSPKAKSEFVQQIVRKLSSQCGSESPRGKPLKDLTNGRGSKVKQLAEAFDSSRSTPDRTSSDSEFRYKSVFLTSKNITHEISDPMYDSSSTLTNSQTTLPGPSVGHRDMAHMPVSAISIASMPLISVKEESENDSQNGYRERAATTATCDTSGTPSTPERQEIHVTISSPGKLSQSKPKERTQMVIPVKPKHSKKIEIHLPSKSSSKSGGKSKMGTIEVLCQQSMLSFDLGMTMHASEQQAVLRQKKEGEQAKQRPLSTGSIEGEAMPAGDGRRRSRTKFFDSAWLHKKFFKVSKC